MKAILVQPPFTQLNAPYPAVHYLEAFLRGRGVEARAYDHSIELYRSIFSRTGLGRVFADARSAIASRAGAVDEATASQLARYLSYEDLYLGWIDGLVAFLAGEDPAMAHRIASAAELPRGQRAWALIEAAEGRVEAEAAGELATRILEDLGDFLSYALDPAFGTVRYAERIASSRGSFAEIRASLESSYVMRVFYAPLLDGFWSERSEELGDSGADPVLALVSLPFPGCLAGGLACAAAAKKALGERVVVVAGGGYVSTELRDLRDPGLFDYFDFLSFDAGYGSLESILDALPACARGEEPRGLHRTMFRRRDGAIGAEGLGEDTPKCGDDTPMRYAESEKAATRTVAPDYRSADFSRYLRFVDSRNPMHRLWSDAPWLKYELARGCYWHRCEFCDTELEYVSGYVPADVSAVAEAASAAAERSGIYGIHFVDEAMPMASLLGLARENRRRAASGERPFHYWGNVRFDASWTAGRCELLAASGLVAASGGIEIATEAGLAMTGKGFGLAELAHCLVAMRRAGLLVHAYLIYGFPGQAGEDIVDSAEVCRQLFASGLVDSAFWHRFVLTRHSRLYAEWKRGERPGLRPIDKPWSFANNDLDFEGSGAYDRFDAPLAAALDAWMEGEGLEKPIGSWFGEGRGKRKPSIAPGLVESLIERAQAAIDEESATGLEGSGGRCYWVAGKAERQSGRQGRLTWAYRGELVSFEGGEAELDGAAAAIGLAGRPEGASVEELAAAAGPANGRLGELRGAGLVLA